MRTEQHNSPTDAPETPADHAPYGAFRSQADPLRQVTAPLMRWRGDAAKPDDDELAVEEPLELRVAPSTAAGNSAANAAGEMAGAAAGETLAVIMRTPGSDEELAAGFLFGEGLVTHPGEIAALRTGLDADGLPSPNVIEIVSPPGIDLAQRAHEAGYTRQFAVNASCGVCGKNSVAAACATLAPLPPGNFTVAPQTLYALPDRLRAGQRVFRFTGGLHAAGLFDGAGELLALREDVGRHNAVDKLVGRALLDDALPALCERILLVSGRLSFEIVLKALAAGIPVLAAVSAPSSLAVDLADSGGVTLVAFLRGEAMNVYTHPQRIIQAGL